MLRLSNLIYNKISNVMHYLFILIILDHHMQMFLQANVCFQGAF